MLQHDFFTCFIEPLRKNDFAHFITGSVAAVFYGEPRTVTPKAEAIPAVFYLEALFSH